jgi:serine O-acetyltransferase
MQQPLENTKNSNTASSFLEPLLTDFRIIFERDPAERNWLEVVFCYPGFHALSLHRLAHWLHRRKVDFIPRLISHLGRFFTPR